MLRTALTLTALVLVAQPSRAQGTTTPPGIQTVRGYLTVVRELDELWGMGTTVEELRAVPEVQTDPTIGTVANHIVIRSLSSDSLDAQLDQLEAYVARLVERDRVLQADNEALTTANQALAGEVAGLRSETSRLQAENDRLRAAADEGDREVRSRLGRLLEALKGLFE